MTTFFTRALRSAAARAAVGLIATTYGACGASEDEPSAGAGGAAGAMQSGGMGGASGGMGGASGSGAGGTGGSSPTVDLFADPSVPDCVASGVTWMLSGSVGGESVSLVGDGFATSNIAPGELYVLGVEPGGGVTVGDTFHPLILTWEGSLMARGTLKELTGKRFLMPGGDPADPSGYCIVSGDFGPSTHEPGVLFKFRARSVRRYENGACTGDELPATLAGCMLRSNEYLP